jgi:hypothetical protein
MELGAFVGFIRKESIMMHGHRVLKLIDAKQAKDTHLYKNTKEKLYKTMAAVWHNKLCRDKPLITYDISA